ncbi:hypothetical protein [Enterococcus casseliflavus]|uniref:hypothetical protein n=1 Tax=Enterococcus casseliflavus TaxID=37734 RepID=UPI003D0B66C1
MYTLTDLIKLKTEKVLPNKNKYDFFFFYLQNALLTNVDGVEEICEMMHLFTLEAQLLILLQLQKMENQQIEHLTSELIDKLEFVKIEIYLPRKKWNQIDQTIESGLRNKNFC